MREQDEGQKLLLQQAGDREKSKFARETALLGSQQTALGQMLGRRASAEATAANRAATANSQSNADYVRAQNSFNTLLSNARTDLSKRAKPGGTLYKKYPFKPNDIKKDKYTKDKLTTPQLIRQIELANLRGSEGLNELKIERYRRDATPVTVLLLTLIGAIIAGRKLRGGSGSHLAVGFIIAAVFILVDRFSTIFSTKGNLPPLLAAWIPNLIFIWVVYYLYKKAPK
jgi:lipopolysaccharide export LptBFGC system permease protein LptF